MVRRHVCIPRVVVHRRLDGDATLIYPGSLVDGYSLLILEAILLTAFGVSWFVKGRKALIRWVAA